MRAVTPKCCFSIWLERDNRESNWMNKIAMGKSARLLSVGAFAAFACGSALAADSYTLDTGHSFPRFAINHFGFSTHRGQFNKTAGKLVLDRTAKNGSVEITVQTASIGTGDPKLEEHLRSADFFNVEKFP